MRELFLLDHQVQCRATTFPLPLATLFLIFTRILLFIFRYHIVPLGHSVTATIPLISIFPEKVIRKRIKYIFFSAEQRMLIFIIIRPVGSYRDVERPSPEQDSFSRGKAFPLSRSKGDRSMLFINILHVFTCFACARVDRWRQSLTKGRGKVSQSVTLIES